MTKAKKLKICDWLLLVSIVVMLASSIQLEATGSRAVIWVWLHIIIGYLFFANIIWHLYLHFGWKSWLQKFRKRKTPATRWLAIFALLTIISALVAFFHWVGSYIHSPIGGLHGKIGFIFIAIAIGHTVKRINFFKNKRKNIISNKRVLKDMALEEL